MDCEECKLKQEINELKQTIDILNKSIDISNEKILVINYSHDKGFYVTFVSDGYCKMAHTTKEKVLESKVSEIFDNVYAVDYEIVKNTFLVNMFSASEFHIKYRIICDRNNYILVAADVIVSRKEKSFVYYIHYTDVLDAKQPDMQLVVEKRYADMEKNFHNEQKKNMILQKALNEVKNANHAKSDYLSRMSHDMRTPMNGIIGITSIMLQDDTLPDKVKKNLIDIKNSEDYLLNLINDTLDMEKIENNKIKLYPKPCTYMEIAKNVTISIKTMVREKGIDFQASYINLTKCPVLMDKMRVTQICMNLLSNAVKFTPKGGKVECRVKKLSSKNDISDILIEVKDNGIGMEKEFLKKIFDPYEQEDINIGINNVGTGLGMTIVRHLVELMGGNINVESTKGKGTCIRVHLHFKYVKNKKNSSIEQKKDLQILLGKKVLLCEDDNLNLRVAESMLSDKGMIVTTARNGKEAVKIFEASENGEFDIILMDIRMPVLNGLEATDRIRNLHRSDAGTIPIIALTGNAYMQEAEECKRAGMNGHIAKPIKVQVLYNIIAQMLLNK